MDTRTPNASLAKQSVQKFPGVRPVKAPDGYKRQERRLKITQIDALTSAWLGFKRLPMRDSPAGLAAHILQGSITPDITFRVLGMTLNRHRTHWVVGPDSCRAPAQRAIAACGHLWRKRQRKAHGAAVAGAFQRQRWMLIVHREAPLIFVPSGVWTNRTREAGWA
jgi:hypothetical protein